MHGVGSCQSAIPASARTMRGPCKSAANHGFSAHRIIGSHHPGPITLRTCRGAQQTRHEQCAAHDLRVRSPSRRHRLGSQRAEWGENQFRQRRETQLVLSRGIHRMDAGTVRGLHRAPCDQAQPPRTAQGFQIHAGTDHRPIVPYCRYRIPHIGQSHWRTCQPRPQKNQQAAHTVL